MSSSRNSTLRQQPISTSSTNNSNYQNLNLHLQKLQKSPVFTKSLAYSLSCIYNILENGRYGMDYLKVLEESNGFQILTKCCTEWSKGKDNNSSDSVQKIREILEKISRVHEVEVKRCLKDVDAARTINKKTTTDIYELNLNKSDDSNKKEYSGTLKNKEAISNTELKTNSYQKDPRSPASTPPPLKASDGRTKLDRSQSYPETVSLPAPLLDRSSARRSIRGGKSFGLGNTTASSPLASPEKSSPPPPLSPPTATAEPAVIGDEKKPGEPSSSVGKPKHSLDRASNPIMLMRSISAKLGSDDEMCSLQSSVRSYSSDESASTSKGVYSSRWRLAASHSTSSIATRSYNSGSIDRGIGRLYLSPSSSPVQSYSCSSRGGSSSEPSSPHHSITGSTLQAYYSATLSQPQPQSDEGSPDTDTSAPNVDGRVTGTAPSTAVTTPPASTPSTPPFTSTRRSTSTTAASTTTATTAAAAAAPPGKGKGKGKTMSSIPEDPISPRQASDESTDCGQSLQATVTSTTTTPYYQQHQTNKSNNNNKSSGGSNNQSENRPSNSGNPSNYNCDKVDKADKMYLLHKASALASTPHKPTSSTSSSPPPPRPPMQMPVFHYAAHPSEEESDSLVARMAQFTKTVSSSHLMQLQLQADSQKRTLRGGGGTSRRSSGLGETTGGFEDSCVSRRATLSAATFAPPLTPLSKS